MGDDSDLNARSLGVSGFTWTLQQKLAKTLNVLLPRLSQTERSFHSLIHTGNKGKNDKPGLIIKQLPNVSVASWIAYSL